MPRRDDILTITGSDVEETMTFTQYFDMKTAWHDNGKYLLAANAELRSQLRELTEKMAVAEQDYKAVLRELWDGACLKHACIGEVCMPNEHPCGNCQANNKQ